MECELPDFYHTSEPKARKERRCCECRAPIKAGEKYVRCTGKWPGDPPRTYSQHETCSTACEHIRDYLNGGECIGFGSLKEWSQEYRQDLERERKTDHNIKVLRDLLAEIRWRERAEKL